MKTDNAFGYWGALAIMAIVGIMGAYKAASAETFIPSGGRTGGGMMVKYIQHVNELNEAGTRVEIRNNVISASTFYLLADDVCTDPNTLFAFHGPMTAGAYASIVLIGIPVHHGYSEERRAYVVNIMAGYYNSRWPGLGDWFKSSGAADKYGYAYTRVRGKALHDAFGVPLCDE